jgi:hypothetical protein
MLRTHHMGMAVALQNKIDLEDDLGTDIRAGTMAPPEPLYPILPELRKELAQCKKVVCNFLFPPMKASPEGLDPLPDVPLVRCGIGFVNAPLTSSEIKDFFM